MYVRFQSRTGSGLFKEAAAFNAELRECRASPRLRAEFRDLWIWLCEYTPVPPSEAYPDALAPTTWYKTTAAQHIVRAWRIAELLRRNGHWIRAVQATHPGEVLFEDHIQAVVIPTRTHYRPAARLSKRHTAWMGDRSSIRSPPALVRS